MGLKRRMMKAETAKSAENVSGPLAGKIVIVTGAGAGIGSAVAAVLVRDGATVLAVDVSGAQETVAAEIGADCVPVHADVADEAAIERLFLDALERFGRVDALVNVAGTLLSRRDEVTPEEYRDMLAVNLRGVLLCCKYALRAMKREGGGSIVSITSAGALNAETRASIPYAAAKAGVHAMTRSLAFLHGPDNIRVNAIASGFAMTERFRLIPADVIAEMEGKASLRRIADPREHAEVAAVLISDKASFVTGAIIPVDGGWSARMA